MSEADETTPGELPAGAREQLGEVAIYFTQLGFTAFGGPAAHIALMERQLVEKRGWLDRRHFLDLLSAINLIPGPNSTQLAISLGYLRAGPLGLVVAGICFILPAVLIILPIAYVYVLYGQTPHAAGAMRGVGAAVLAIVAAGATVFLHWRRWPAADVGVLFAAALAGIARSGWRPKKVMPVIWLAPLAVGVVVPGGMALMALLFLKIGATLYGSGYLLLPYLRTNFVTGHAWLTERQLLDSVAVGQVTPRPLLTTATFIGFILGYRAEFGGWFGGGFTGAVSGALVATAAIFGPSFVFVTVLGNVLPKIRNHPAARGALDAMNAAVVALIAVTVIQMSKGVLLSGSGAIVAGVIAAGTLIVLVKWELNATWPIVAAGVIGWIVMGS